MRDSKVSEHFDTKPATDGVTVIGVMRYVDLAKAETSWEVTQPARDGRNFSDYLKGSSELR